MSLWRRLSNPVKTHEVEVLLQKQTFPGQMEGSPAPAPSPIPRAAPGAQRGPEPRANALLCFCAASAFSERYLGLHGLDNRAYEVCLGQSHHLANTRNPATMTRASLVSEPLPPSPPRPRPLLTPAACVLSLPRHSPG